MLYNIRRPSVSQTLQRYTHKDLYVAEYNDSEGNICLENVYEITKDGLKPLTQNKLSKERKLFNETFYTRAVNISDKFSLNSSWFRDKDIAALVKLTLLQNLKEDTLEEIESIKKQCEKTLPKENTEMFQQYKEKFAELFI